MTRRNVRHRVATHNDRDLAKTVSEHDETITVLKAAVFGDKETIGINEQLRTIRGMIDTLIRLAWIVVGATVVVVISGTTTAVIYLIREMAK